MLVRCTLGEELVLNICAVLSFTDCFFVSLHCCDRKTIQSLSESRLNFLNRQSAEKSCRNVRKCDDKMWSTRACLPVKNIYAQHANLSRSLKNLLCALIICFRLVDLTTKRPYPKIPDVTASSCLPSAVTAPLPPPWILMSGVLMLNSCLLCLTVNC